MPYHHGHLRESLVDAAVALAAERGPEAVALRELARRVGVSPTAAYRYFADRRELMLAARARALTVYDALMAKRIAAAADGDDAEAAFTRLESFGRAHVAFATANPGLFRLICSPTTVEAETDDVVKHPNARLAAPFDELVTSSAIDPERRAYGEIAAFSAVHGYAFWILDGPGRDATTEERERGLAFILSMIRRSVQ